MPLDEPPDLLYRLIIHELTHQFEFDIIPTSLIRRSVPLWVNEGLSDYMTGIWRPIDLMTVRDAAVADIVPKMSELEGYTQTGSVRMIYNLGHAVFEFIESRWGKEGIRQYLFSLRKSVIGGGEDAYMEAFKLTPEEFDQEFDKYLKDRFKPFRDKERPADYGRNLAPDPEESVFIGAVSIEPSPSGDLIAMVTGNRRDRELDIVLVSATDGSMIRNLTNGFDQDRGFEFIVQNGMRSNTVPWMSWSPTGDQVAYFVRAEKWRTLILQNVLNRNVEQRVELRDGGRSGVARHLARRQEGGVRRAAGRRRRHLGRRPGDARGHQPDQGRVRRFRPDLVARRAINHLRRPRQRQRKAVPSRRRDRPEDAADVRHARRLRRAVPRRRDAGLLVDGHRPGAAGRARGGAQRQHLQHLDAQPEDRPAPAVHRRARRQHVRRRAERRARRAAHRLRRLLQGRVRAARARSARSDRHRGDVRLRRAGTDHRLPGAAVAHADRAEQADARARSRSCSSTAVRR